MSTQQHDEYLVSYGEWRAAAETFEQTMRRALRPEPVDETQLALESRRSSDCIWSGVRKPWL